MEVVRLELGALSTNCYLVHREQGTLVIDPAADAGTILDALAQRGWTADAVVLLCPNYNDALSANLTAAINRLTALYRAAPFTHQAVVAIVVSGYSGGDIVASQVVSALNMNKGFWLPPEFCLLETANDAGDAIALPGIEARLDRFAKNIRGQL